jgi:hypothetical protein
MGRPYYGGSLAVRPGIFLGGGELLVVNVPGVARSVQVLTSYGSLVRGKVCGISCGRA